MVSIRQPGGCRAIRQIERIGLDLGAKLGHQAFGNQGRTGKCPTTAMRRDCRTQDGTARRDRRSGRGARWPSRSKRRYIDGKTVITCLTTAHFPLKTTRESDYGVWSGSSVAPLPLTLILAPLSVSRLGWLP